MQTEVHSVVIGTASCSAAPPGPLTVAGLIDRYMAQYSGRDTAFAYRIRWWLARLGTMPVHEVTDDHIFPLLKQLEESPAAYYAGKDVAGAPILRAKPHGRSKTPARRSGATINRYVASASSVFTWAMHERMVPRTWRNPCSMIRKRPESAGRVRFLEEGERQRLLQASRAATWPRMYLFVLMGLTTGARRGELLGLRWSDIRFDQDPPAAYCAATKNGDRKSLPLVPAVVAELQRFRSKNGQDLVFASTKKPRKAYTVASHWPTLLKAADIQDFRIHDLRHSFASYLAQSGASILELADALGHRQLTMTKRYSHLTVNTKAALINRVLGELR